MKRLLKGALGCGQMVGGEEAPKSWGCDPGSDTFDLSPLGGLGQVISCIWAWVSEGPPEPIILLGWPQPCFHSKTLMVQPPCQACCYQGFQQGRGSRSRSNSPAPRLCQDLGTGATLLPLWLPPTVLTCLPRPPAHPTMSPAAFLLSLDAGQPGRCQASTCICPGNSSTLRCGSALQEALWVP